MLTQSTPNSLALFNREQAQLQSVTGILNCYLREYAIPNGHVHWHADSRSLPQVLRQPTQYSIVTIDFPEVNGKLAFQARYVSALGKIQLAERPWLKKPGQGWCKVNAQQTLQWLLSYLSAALDIEFNQEIIEQLQNSLQVTECFINHNVTGQAHNTFIASEQSLLWGHAFHPTPKSRTGVSMDDLLTCSPEVGARFQLYWFKIASHLVETLGDTSHGAHPLQAIAQLQPGTQSEATQDYVLYPCHPWESYTILANPLVQKAIDQQLIIPLGLAGQEVLPTSSVRTLYHPDLNWFVKFSINVRLTNCVRKNAWYELDSAVQLTDILKPIRDKEQLRNPVFNVMTEPFATTVNLQSLNDENATYSINARESFGVLYRENFSLSEIDLLQPTLAAGLFAYDASGNSRIAKQLEQKAQQTQQPYAPLAEIWFERYVHCLLPGIFNYFFKHGVAFEPHLQNTLIGFDHGMPCCVWIRDLEGTKLLPEKWPTHQLERLSERARQSVYYSREQGWKRIGYCALINNLSEAVFYLANQDIKLEKRLWQKLKQAIAHWQAINGTQPELENLIAGGSIPSKNNFTTRLMKKADKESNYTLIPVPWGKAESQDHA